MRRMTVNRSLISQVVLHAAGLAVIVQVAGAAIAAPAVKPASGAAHGHDIFVSYGCYQCHGYQGQGSVSGPKLAPNPLPIGAFTHQLRNPRNLMPVYTVKTVSPADLADIYAYLQTIPKAKAVSEIPLLNQ